MDTPELLVEFKQKNRSGLKALLRFHGCYDKESTAQVDVVLDYTCGYHSRDRQQIELNRVPYFAQVAFYIHNDGSFHFGKEFTMQEFWVDGKGRVKEPRKSSKYDNRVCISMQRSDKLFESATSAAEDKLIALVEENMRIWEQLPEFKQAVKDGEINRLKRELESLESSKETKLKELETLQEIINETQKELATNISQN